MQSRRKLKKCSPKDKKKYLWGDKAEYNKKGTRQKHEKSLKNYNYDRRKKHIESSTRNQN